MKRIFLIVLDSFGIGAMPDAESFGDVNVNTLAACAATGKLHIPNLIAAGLGNIDGVTCLPKTDAPAGSYARMSEASMGKDTTIGHWEIAGIVSPDPLPTYPNGFPEEVMKPFCEAVGRGYLANAPWSGTAVIQEYGDEHVKTGDLIVYTSADSVFQIAAHEDVVPLETLYEYCHIAREQLKGKHGVGRVIARPFVGTSGAYTRTPNRHDYSLEPPKTTLLDAVKAAGLDSIAVGKIHDIFAGKGDTEYVYNKSNADGYAYALNEFDAWLGSFMETLGEDDLVMITADHGCDPAYTATTDHTREYVPLLALGKGVKPGNLGTRQTFADIAATVADLLNVELDTPGVSFAKEIVK